MSVRFTYNEQQIEDNKITDLGILDNEIASLQIWCPHCRVMSLFLIAFESYCADNSGL